MVQCTVNNNDKTVILSDKNNMGERELLFTAYLVTVNWEKLTKSQGVYIETVILPIYDAHKDTVTIPEIRLTSKVRFEGSQSVKKISEGNFTVTLDGRKVKPWCKTY